MNPEDRRTELERLGYSIVSKTDDELIGVRSRWCWDGLATKLTSVVFVRSVPILSASEIRADAARLPAAAKDLDPSRLPQGLQKNRVAIAVYIAETVEPDARQICASPQPIRLPSLFYPAAFERSSGTAYYSKATPLWGGVYYAKFRYLVQRLLEPATAPAKEPVSVFGIVMTVLVGALLLSGLAALVLVVVLG
jgi:hypothetical protein